MYSMHSFVIDFMRKYQERHGETKGTPLAISFLVTNRCVLRCKHCFYHKSLNQDVKSELSLMEYERLSLSLDQFFFGLFCGGEPFLRNDFSDVVNMFRKNNKLLWTGTATNGQLTQAILKHTEAICKASPKQPYFLTFSIEGWEGVHDSIRGEGTFRKAIASWQECKKLAAQYSNLKLSLSTVFSTINQDEMAKFFRWALAELKPSGINLLLVRQAPRGGETMKAVDPARYEEARQVIKDSFDRGELGDANNPLSSFMVTVNELVSQTLISGRKEFTCYAGVHGAFIDYNGAVNVCEVFPDAAASVGAPRMIGNLREYDMDFKRLWNSDQAQLVRTLVNHHPPCIGCTHETEGYLPSLLISPNRLSHIFEHK